MDIINGFLIRILTRFVNWLDKREIEQEESGCCGPDGAECFDCACEAEGDAAWPEYRSPAEMKARIGEPKRVDFDRETETTHTRRAKKMKTLVALLAIVMLSCTPAFAIDDPGMDSEGSGIEPVVQTVCPVTRISDQNRCFRCHTFPSFAVKQATGFEGHLLEDWMRTEDSKPYVHYTLDHAVGFGLVRDFRMIQEYISAHPGEIDRVVFSIFSPGGSVFHAWETISVMDRLKNSGVVVETRSGGFSASAAFFLFATGSKGHRLVSPTAEFMYHEISAVMFENVTPSGSEETTVIFRHLQDTINEHLAAVSGVSKEFLDEKVNKSEWWINGREMVKFGFADGYLK